MEEAGVSTRGPRLLAIDSATESIAVAACDAHRESLLDAEGGARASAVLVGEALARLADCGFAPRRLDAVAYGRGPGAFTGLRCAAAVAQGFALGVGCAALAIDSLLIIAEDARLRCAAADDEIEVGVAMDARIGELYAARYRWSRGAWRTIEPPALTTARRLVEGWRGMPPAVIAGSGPMLDDAHRAAFAELAAEPLPPSRTGRAAALLRLARLAFAAGERVDAADALPVYLRDKVAQTSAEREAIRALAAAVRP